MTKLFGTDGIPGTASILPTNAETALTLGRVAICCGRSHPGIAGGDGSA